VTVVPESTFTPPRPDCPRPEYWHATDGDSTELEVTELVAAFVRALQPDLVVETGAAFGQTAEAIGRALQANCHGRLWTTEPDPERAAATEKRVDGLPVWVAQVESLRVEFAPEERIGFAWFDSLIHLRVAEFRHYRRWMEPGAIIGFHDCGPQHPLRPHIERLADERLLRPIYLPTPRGAMFAEVL
jgi:predicted O-methyltransferase YrrM